MASAKKVKKGGVKFKGKNQIKSYYNVLTLKLWGDKYFKKKLDEKVIAIF